ncbi:VWA domain-containing protein [Nakamurella sp. YIM 132087]|uniref:Mg-protoporphyrin IX chelatase n=1 Tax=Nakamurella alba TaxID=2665158 RepID=A0A7K1FG24_9ACTN|nr:VWA domain-containing protein [Nakamurella alba]
MSLALLLCAVSPAIGGVLVRGEKGTAKSTTVRALTGLLPPVRVVAGCRFSCDPADPDPRCPDLPQHRGDAGDRPARLVELPVGATEDRVVGSLHLQRALTDGVTEYEPGLLAAAHRGLLYVDEVNLLHDHLVDLLLDAAAMGRASVERDGVSVTHGARFVLVGTMNPEEGELRPQLLDRFGLTVEVTAPREPGLRAEVVRRRLDFDDDPAGFVDRYAAAEAALTSRIDDARRRLAAVRLDDAALTAIATVCAAFEVDGMRADIVTAKAAAAHAAWSGRDTVQRADIRAAARLALPHRRRRNPFDAPGLDEELLDRILDDLEPEPEPEPEPDPEPDPGPGSGSEPGSGPDGGQDGGAPDGAPGDGSPADSTSADPAAADRGPAAGPDGERAPGIQAGTAGTPFRTRRFEVDGLGAGEAGRRSRALTGRGRAVGSVRPGDGSGSGLHLLATVHAAAPHQVARGRDGAGLRLTGEDLRLAVREGRESNLVLLCVDASGSMAARRRMDQVKTTVLSLLLDAYQRRDKVGLITFRAGAADLVLPPTSSVDVAARRLADLPVGGRTPIAEGLLLAGETVRRERIRDPRRRTLLVLVTDGRATHGPDAPARALAAAGLLRADGVAALVVDCETGRFRMGLAAPIATALDAEYVPLGEIDATALAGTVRSARGDRAA